VELALVELLELQELARAPQEAAVAQALPLGRRGGEALARAARLGAGVEPVAQRLPALDEGLVGQLVRRLAAQIAGDEEPAAHQVLEGGAPGLALAQLGGGLARARAL